MIVREATAEDNAGLLALTQRTPMGGLIPLIIDRRPDFFALQRWRGKGTILVAEDHGTICATINCTRLQVWHQGQVWTADYLCDLKVLEEYRRGLALPRLLRAVRQHIEADPPNIVLCVVARGNDLAEATIRGRLGMPPFRFVDEFAVQQILPRRKPPTPSAWSIEHHDGVPQAAADLLNDHFRWRDLAPIVEPDGEATRASTTLIASGRDGEIAAAMVLLNTDPVKQNTVVDLPWYLHVLRVTVNAVPQRLGLPRLPGIGEPIRILYARLWGCRQGAESALHDLISAARWEAHRQGCHFLSIAGTRQDQRLLRRYPSITFHSQLFAARHDDALDVISALRPGYVVEDFSLV